MTNHLYIHIPFCKSICSYCDFKRIKYDSVVVESYIDNVILELINKYKKRKFKTIYIGGGTPNCLTDNQLQRILSIIKNYLADEYEFTIELNPEFVSDNQVAILKKNMVNRVSLGVQSCDDIILKNLNRHHSINQVKEAIKLLYTYKITNISCDFIYGFNDMTLNHIDDIEVFVKTNNIKHMSFYCLELKENSSLNKQNYQLSDDRIEQHLKYIQNKFSWMINYEVSNYAIDERFFSKHNLCYWKSNNWAAIGWYAYGFENKIEYHYAGSIDKWELNSNKLNSHQYYLQILMMGLRLKCGIDLIDKKNKDAYAFFKEQIDNCSILEIVDNHLVCTNFNLLDNFLEHII